MRKVLFAFISLSLPIYAQTTEPDSTNYHVLDEIVVDAVNQQTSSNTTTYIPSSLQKEAAYDAVSLLSHMAIPQLDINMANMTVSTNTGQNVSIFIDYVAATSHDLEGLMPKDVRRVEYLINPQDTRFKGAKYVVNFIMHKYEWGGYTKLKANGRFIDKNINGSVYSKFVYKKMTFDLYADEMYRSNHHNGTKTTESFHLPNLYGSGTQNIERINEPLSSSYINNQNNITFRALYSTDNTQISNYLYLNTASTPHSDHENYLRYKDEFIPQSNANSKQSGQSTLLRYIFDIFKSINPKLSWDINANCYYNINKSKSEYQHDALTIINNATEKEYYANFQPYLLYSPNSHNSIMPFFLGEYRNTRIDYYGNSPSRQHYKTYGYVAGLNYSFNQEKWSAGATFNWTFANTDFSGVKDYDNYPQGNFYGTYSPNQHNQFNIGWAFGKTIPETQLKSPNMLQQDELIWYAGNPYLENYWQHQMQFAYTWLPNNKYQLSADVSYYMDNNTVMTLYTPNGPNGTLLRQYANDGDKNLLIFGINATAKFLSGKLIVNIHPTYKLSSLKGSYNRSINRFKTSAQITWFFGNFYLLGWYLSPQKAFYSNTYATEQVPSNYQIHLGWRFGNWQASVIAYDFFRTNWETSQQTLKSPYYSYDKINYGTSSHMRFQVSVTYTISYGKKVHQTNEISSFGSSGSAILK